MRFDLAHRNTVCVSRGPSCLFQTMPLLLVMFACDSPIVDASPAGKKITPEKPRAAASGIDATREPKTFRGVAWGAPISDVVAATKCKTVHTIMREAGLPVPAGQPDGCGDNFKMGDVDIAAGYEFNDGKLTDVSISYLPLQFDYVKSVLLDKYGSPSSDEIVKTMTKGGVPYDDELIVWEFPSVRIEAHRYGVTVDRGVTYFSLRSWLDERARREKESKQKAKDAF